LNKRTSINSIPTIHKEKEMADFRKWLYAFAGVALLTGLTVPASAQSTLMQCTGSANNPLIRAEEYTALAGDVFITCTGGIPTTVGTSVPKATITVFVTNTAITSKLTQVSDDPNWDEALLIMDEAGATTSTNGLLNCGSATAPFETTPNDLTCNIISANGDGTGDYTGVAARPNVFQGRLVDGSFGQAIQFIGVPIDPPGPSFVGTGTDGCGEGVTCLPNRTMRITNLRVNSVALNVYNLGNSFSLTTINTTVSFNGTNFGGNQIVNVQNGTVRIGLLVSQSTAQNEETLSGAASFLQCNAVSGFTTNSILLSEGFPTAFKVKNFAEIIANGIAPGLTQQFYQWNPGHDSITAADISQNVPNALYNTETGINYDTADPLPTPNPPSGTGSNGVATVGIPFNDAGGHVTGIASAGEVSQGTRFALRFAGIPTGSNPSVPLSVDLETGALGAGNNTGVIVLVCGTDVHGNGGSASACLPGGITGTSPIVQDANGNGLVVYEVAFADPNALEFANVIVYVNPTIDLNATPPVGGTPQVGVTGTANASFAPFYATSTPGVGAAELLTSAYPIPRFVDNPLPTPPVSLFTYGKCACDMLFPWVVGNSAINTSIVVANTSLDPCAGSTCAAGFTAQPQSGRVTFWFFGTADFNSNPATFGSATDASTVIASQQSVLVPPGSYMAFVISPSTTVAGGQTAGNGLKPIAGPFAGYVIAQSEFQYCHGIASLSGVGLTPQTYLGLVLDKARNFFESTSPVVGNAQELERTTQTFADELEN
jgi:hypothetical protein